jgi:hypothetical protein
LYRFVAAEKAVFEVRIMCNVLGVAPSAYYAWEREQNSTHSRRDAELISIIQRIFAQFRGRYGAPRILGELAKQGIQVSRKRGADLEDGEPVGGRVVRPLGRGNGGHAGVLDAHDLTQDSDLGFHTVEFPGEPHALQRAIGAPTVDVGHAEVGEPDGSDQAGLHTGGPVARQCDSVGGVGHGQASSLPPSGLGERGAHGGDSSTDVVLDQLGFAASSARPRSASTGAERDHDFRPQAAKRPRNPTRGGHPKPFGSAGGIETPRDGAPGSIG